MESILSGRIGNYLHAKMVTSTSDVCVMLAIEINLWAYFHGPRQICENCENYAPQKCGTIQYVTLITDVSIGQESPWAICYSGKPPN